MVVKDMNFLALLGSRLNRKRQSNDNPSCCELPIPGTNATTFAEPVGDEEDGRFTIYMRPPSDQVVDVCGSPLTADIVNDQVKEIMDNTTLIRRGGLAFFAASQRGVGRLCQMFEYEKEKHCVGGKIAQGYVQTPLGRFSVVNDQLALNEIIVATTECYVPTCGLIGPMRPVRIVNWR